jgi:hypothetical protein
MKLFLQNQNFSSFKKGRKIITFPAQGPRRYAPERRGLEHHSIMEDTRTTQGMLRGTLMCIDGI